MVVNEKTEGRGREKKRERKKTRDPRTTIDPIGLKVWGRSSRKSQATFTNRCQSFAKNIFLDRKESPPSSIGTLRLRLDRAWPCATDKTWTEVLAERFQTRHPWSKLPVGSGLLLRRRKRPRRRAIFHRLHRYPLRVLINFIVFPDCFDSLPIYLHIYIFVYFFIKKEET